MENEAAIQEFCSITACTPDQARFFLESSGWQVETAVQNYYESDATLPRVIEGDDEEEGDEATAGGAMSFSPPRAAPPAPETGRPPASNPSFSSRGPTVAGLSSGRRDSAKDKKATSSRGAIRTLSDFNRTSGEDSDEDAQEYFTGGEKSGMMVQDPQKGNRVDAIFEQARKMGAQEGPSEASSHARSGRNTFTGVGRTLTGNVTQPGVGATQSQPVEPIVRNITFWRNGFTVDNGSLRRLDDPANAQFLTSISKSECPKELEPAERGTPVHVNLMRKDEDWSPPPEPRNVPFHGTGRTLGSTSSTEATNTPIPSNQPSQGLVVDDSQPVASIQLRLSDGTRMVARFNYHHTVADIRNFIDAARPGHTRTYQLQTMGFPPKVLTDASQTVEAAGLINAVVIQKA